MARHRPVVEGEPIFVGVLKPHVRALGEWVRARLRVRRERRRQQGDEG
jgi:hypothetical protein